MRNVHLTDKKKMLPNEQNAFKNDCIFGAVYCKNIRSDELILKSEVSDSAYDLSYSTKNAGITNFHKVMIG